MSEHLLFLAFPLLSPPLVYKVLSLFMWKKVPFVNNGIEADLDDLSFKILESVGKG